MILDQDNDTKPSAGHSVPGNDGGFVWTEYDLLGRAQISHDHQGCALYRGSEAFALVFLGCQLVTARQAVGLKTPDAAGVDLGLSNRDYSQDDAARKAAVIAHRVAVGELMIRNGLKPFVSFDHFLSNLQHRS